ncbi:PEP-CTERM sorting domain-containing protein [Zooshikella harenae]|uniref:PEP-CTERM sorting domain-containing protein n=1 Tax=Zooshikella harenae TaxID=2827238 RepID=A0ABS5ZED1_9GAMM|nr:PEP-CTERM sorting domain-containing protein [Zooshikella harenae]MBU2712421.1 PEP-CTERM sorting domain-containing protein [Zooshikella harenae]
MNSRWVQSFKYLFLTTILATSFSTHAVITQVGSTAGMSQGPYALEDFEDASFVSGFTASASSGVSTVSAGTYASGGTPSGTSGLSTGTFPDPIMVAFATPASSVGMYFGNDDTCCSSTFTAFLDIFDVGGLIGTIGVVANMNDFADQFIGFISDEAVTKVTLRYGTGSDVGLYHYIDDLQFNNAGTTPEPDPIPEPGTLGLFALLAGVLLRRKTY